MLIAHGSLDITYEAGRHSNVTNLKQLLITFSIEVVIDLACLIQSSSSMTGYSVEFQ